MCCASMPAASSSARTAAISPGGAEILKRHGVVGGMERDDQPPLLRPHYGLMTSEALICASTMSYMLETMPTCNCSFRP